MGFELLALAVPVATLLGGTVATYGYDRRAPLLWRIPGGTSTGLAALGLIALPLSMRFGITAGVVAAASAVVASPLLLLLSNRYRALLRADLAAEMQRLRHIAMRPSSRSIAAVLLWAAGAVLLWWVAVRVMFVRTDGVFTGVSHNIGDLPFHLTVTNRFLYGGNFPPEHPSFAGAGFTYPFLTDFLGAMFVGAGVPIDQVMVWSTWLLLLVIAALMYRWTLDLTGSRTAASLAPLLTLLSGGLGWWNFAVDVSESSRGMWALLARPPDTYTITNDGEFRWGNMITALLVTQRGLLLGLPLALVVFHLWWRAMRDDAQDARERLAQMVAAGAIAGMLPLVHGHTFMVVLGMAACLMVLSADRWRWLPFFAWALALGLPQVWWLAHASGISGGRFVGWSIGWDRGEQNAVIFWLKNTGLFIPLLCAAFLWRGKPPLVPAPLRVYYAPFILCFIVPNLLRLAPWIWDNIKVLVYWFVASVPLVALVLARIAQGARWRGLVAAALFVSLTLAGALDVWRVACGAFEWRVFDRRGIELAALVAERTSPASLILHAPIPNHPVALTGRRSLMGYPGHVWSHGLDPGPREADIRRMYAGGSDAAPLLARYAIDYVVVGPAEVFDFAANEPFFERYERVGDAGGYRLYRIARDAR